MHHRLIVIILPALAGVLLLGGALEARAQGFRWWDDEHFTRELGLTREQSTAIEAIFQKELPMLRKNRDALDAAEARLELMIHSASEGELLRHIQRVESLRARRNIARTTMLLRMRAVLEPQQRAKLGALHQDWERRQQVR